MNVKLRTTTVIFFQLFAVICSAQNNQFKFNVVEGNNGKPLGKINAIAQDPYGYMWFAGEGEKCLYRYDGNRVSTFRHDDANPNSLGITIPQTVVADNAGMIWIGGDGLDQYNPATGIFKHFRNDKNDPGSLAFNGVNSILKDRQGRLWVGTENGLDRFDEKTEKFIHYRNKRGDQKSLSSNVVWRIYEDRQGVIWIATGFPWFKKDPEDGGLNRLEPDGTFTRYMHNPNNPHSLINNKVAAMYEDNRGIFWVGTSGDGLHTMDRKTGLFKRYPYNPKAPDQLSRPPLKRGEDNDKITFITGDTTGAIWIGTMYSGINRYDTATKKITHYKASNGFTDSTSWNAFTSRDGELWITTESANLFRLNPFHKTIRSITTGNEAWNFQEDKQGYLWAGTMGNGLFKYDQQLNLIAQFKNNPSDLLSLPNNTVGALFQNHENNIWISTDKGIRRLDVATQKFYRFNDEENLKAFEDSNATDILQDKQGFIWIARWGQGLLRYNPKDHSINHFYSIETDSATISSNNVGQILEDRSGALWAGSDKGLNRLDKKTGKFVRYAVGNGWALHLYQDSKGDLWAGADKGLYKYNKKEDRFINFFDAQSELNLVSFGGVTEDDSKNLWFFTQSAIISLSLITNQIFMYDSKYGIVPNSMATWKAAYKNRKGQILIPHGMGFYTFPPGELIGKTDLKIIITDLLINSQPVLPRKESPIRFPVEDVSNIVLSYKQHNITLNFAAIDYREPQATRYFTKLENYDDVWHEALYEKGSSFYNLPPGTFVYKIKAFNTDGTKAEKAITIEITPPWWKTWWAYSVYGLLLLVTIFAIYWYQKQRIIRIERQKRQQFELAQAKEIEKAYTELKATQAQLIQSEKMASLGELTAGIAHEIQNPLNFVNNFSEVSSELIDEMTIELEKGDIDEAKAIAADVKQNLEKINHHGKRADAIVKGMLQHSRSSSGIKEPTDINALCDEYLRLCYHGLKAKDKSFNATIKTDFDETIGNINIIPQDIGRVILNLVTNAFYAAPLLPEGGFLDPDYVHNPTVWVSTKRIVSPSGDGGVSISVRDNGPGIPQKIINKIFQPFFTTKPTGQGTGLGLSLSYDIVKAHGGEIKVETKEGEGCEFIILLPIV